MPSWRTFAIATLSLVAPLHAAFGAAHRAEQTRDVHWRRDGVELSGVLHFPDTPGKHPLAIILPGSGCMPLTHRFYQAHVRELTRRGVAVFAYDKRGCGASKGSWRDVDLQGLAADVQEVLPILAADSNVDAKKIGLWGLSQGGWVALILAGNSPLVQHVVLLSGPPMSPADQGDEVVALGMREKKIDEASISAAVALNRQLTNVYRTDTGWEPAEQALKEAQGKPWIDASGIGLIPRADSTYWRWLRRILDYDPLPALRSLKQPLLAVYGERDVLVPGPRSQRIIDSLARAAAGPRETFLVAGAGHQLRPGANADWSAEYWNAVEAWLRKRGILN